MVSDQDGFLERFYLVNLEFLAAGTFLCHLEEVRFEFCIWPESENH